MSTYFYLYQSLQATQYQVVTILAMLGLVWGGCWVWVDRRSRHKAILKWSLLAAAILTCGYTIVMYRVL